MPPKELIECKNEFIEYCRKNNLVVPFFSKKINKVVSDAFDLSVGKALSKSNKEIAVNRSEVYDKMNELVKEKDKQIEELKDRINRLAKEKGEWIIHRNQLKSQLHKIKQELELEIHKSSTYFQEKLKCMKEKEEIFKELEKKAIKDEGRIRWLDYREYLKIKQKHLSQKDKRE